MQGNICTVNSSFAGHVRVDSVHYAIEGAPFSVT
jgi:hypothetical protein